MPRAPVFTERHLLTKAKPGKRLHITDTPCLYFDASPTFKGGKVTGTFTHRYSQPRAPEHPEWRGPREKAIGQYPEVTLEMAKNRVAHARTIMKRDHKDPYRQPEWREAETTFEQLLDMWFKNRESSWLNRKQLRDAELCLREHCKALATLPLFRIRPKHVHEALISLYLEHPEQARRTTRKLFQVFNFAKSKDLYRIDNPARWKGVLDHLFPPPPEGKAGGGQFASMPYTDLPKFFREKLNPLLDTRPAGRALKFAILTATRTSETLKMVWSEYDPVECVWTIPAERMRKGRKRNQRKEHRVPLSPEAIALLEGQKQEYATGSSYVFAGRYHGGSDHGGMLNELRRMGVEEVTVHGMRAAFKTWSDNETSFDPNLVEMCMSHTVGPAVMRAYQRSDILGRRREIMAAWAIFCETGVSPNDTPKITLTLEEYQRLVREAPLRVIEGDKLKARS